jgi:hypothetical protein
VAPVVRVEGSGDEDGVDEVAEEREEDVFGGELEAGAGAVLELGVGADEDGDVWLTVA